MQCTKCGAEQAAGREECSACGIVFARWQPRAPRKPTLSTPLDAPEQRPGIPVPFIIVGLFFLVVGGFIWTRHHQEARASINPDDVLNEINNKGATLRRQLREEQTAIRRAQNRAAMTSAAINEPKLPSDIDESKIQTLIEQCSYFQEQVQVDIPKEFHANLAALTVKSYPALGIAAAQHFVEFDPPSFSLSNAARYLPDPTRPGDTIKVNVVTFAYSKADIVDEGNVYRFGLGRRHVEITRITPYGESQLTVALHWTFDRDAAADLAPEKEVRSGSANLKRTADGWTRTEVYRQTRSGNEYIRCE